MDNFQYLKTAKKAALAGTEISLGYYNKNLEIKIKEDKTPFTRADVETESAIIESIKSEFPDHSFYGKESGRSENRSEYIWIIDPIDGTKNYLAQIPLWGTLIALMHKNEIIFGLSYIPLLDEMLFAEKGYGDQLIELLNNVSRQRSFGDLWPYHLVASGRIDILVEPIIEIYDVTPFDLIIKEAGGKCSDIEGNNLSFDISTFVATNGYLHNPVLDLMRK